jgi:hypothetical protein
MNSTVESNYNVSNAIFKTWKDLVNPLQWFRYGRLPRSTLHTLLLYVVWLPFMLQIAMFILVPVQNRYWEFNPVSFIGIEPLDSPDLEKDVRCVNGVCTAITSNWKECKILPCIVSDVVLGLHGLFRILLVLLIVPEMLSWWMYTIGLYNTMALQTWMWACVIGLGGSFILHKWFYYIGQWKAKKTM